MVRSILLAPVLMLATAAAVAQSTAPTVPAAGTKIARPAKEKLVCENEEQIGSRLGGHRVCKTAAQWAEERAQTRMTIDRSQTQRGCVNGSAGC